MSQMETDKPDVKPEVVVQEMESWLRCLKAGPAGVLREAMVADVTDRLAKAKEQVRSARPLPSRLQDATTKYKKAAVTLQDCETTCARLQAQLVDADKALADAKTRHKEAEGELIAIQGEIATAGVGQQVSLGGAVHVLQALLHTLSVAGVDPGVVTLVQQASEASNVCDAPY